jgi:uncharacterized protein YecT (DUF1311 family)
VKNLPLLAVFTFFLLPNKAMAMPCADAISTKDHQECGELDLNKATTELTKYLDGVRNHHKEDSSFIKSLNLSQQAWETYAKAHCDSIYSYYRDGSMRYDQALGCHTRLTRQRTFELWKQFLTYPDGTPPVLKQPI